MKNVEQNSDKVYLIIDKFWKIAGVSDNFSSTFKIVNEDLMQLYTLNIATIISTVDKCF